jgi:hypothetical protein
MPPSLPKYMMVGSDGANTITWVSTCKPAAVVAFVVNVLPPSVERCWITAGAPPRCTVFATVGCAATAMS